jgi:hypothetical protein
MKRIPFILLGAVSVLLILMGARGQAGDAKATAFRPILDADAFKELTARSIQLIEATAKTADKNAADKIEVEAAILVGYTLSAKNGKTNDVHMLRGAALAAAKAANKNELRGLADFGKSISTAPKASVKVKDWTKVLHATEPMMLLFKGKAKGGEGIHADLQYHPKLKNQNGIEALINALASKKLSDESMAKVEKELPNLAFRVAVIASITHEFKSSKDADKWRDYAADMRDASIEIAESARKKNGEGILKAALALENSCVECHSVFKNK